MWIMWRTEPTEENSSITIFKILYVYIMNADAAIAYE